ncbi:IS701 family transposase [Streptomyces sp. NPDC057362]|uniref:IS701 family transposase n=1 Tax=Streptomyces sp. NPDC057362 TaxID=3346106 RepID=UPI003632B6E3
MTTHAPARPTSVDDYTEALFAALPRVDQRRWARTYLRGLLVTPGKKTLRRIAQMVGTSPTASQSMHQFINASTWDWEPVRDELARWTSRLVAPDAYVIDLAYIRKRGDRSCGVHTRFVPHVGRTLTCQVGTGAFLATQQFALPIDWRLHLPARWLTEEDGLRARVPEFNRAQSLEEEALDLLTAWDRRGWTQPLPVVADLSGQGDNKQLLRGLAERRQPFVVAVQPGLRFTTTKGLVREARSLTVDGSPAGARAIPSVLARVPGIAAAGTPSRDYRIFATRQGPTRTPRWWLTSLTDARVDHLLALTQLLDRSAEAITDMGKQFGLADFEGRSFPGWHHHMTIMSAAYVWHRLQTSPPERELSLV